MTATIKSKSETNVWLLSAQFQKTSQTEKKAEIKMNDVKLAILGGEGTGKSGEW